MAATIIDGRAIARDVKEQLKERVEKLNATGRQVKIGVILVGDNDASKVYIRMKEKGCNEIGASQEVHSLPGDASEEDLLALVKKLNEDASICGIIVEQPLPNHINRANIMEKVNPEKDLDGYNPMNYGRLMAGEERMPPATPAAVMHMLSTLDLNLQGKNVVVVSHSPVVGRPLTMMLLNQNATVTVVHEYTKDVRFFTKEADIVVTAAGGPSREKAHRRCGVRSCKRGGWRNYSCPRGRWACYSQHAIDQCCERC